MYSVSIVGAVDTLFYDWSKWGEAPKSVKRLKRWPTALKCRIVEETCVPGASVAVVGRRHNANANQVFDWRKKYRQGKLVDKKMLARNALPTAELVRIGVIDQDGALRPPPVVNGHCAPLQSDNGKLTASPDSRLPSIIEIELPGGINRLISSAVLRLLMGPSGG